MTPVRTAPLVLAAILGLAGAARAQRTDDAVRPAPPREPADSSKADRPVRVRASHRVDVIGPGERVETVLDRVRTSRPAPPASDVKPSERPPIRGPDRGRDTDRSGPDSQRGSGGPRPPPGNSGPPSDRSHR
jgi:hypothetical protein